MQVDAGLGCYGSHFPSAEAIVPTFLKIMHYFMDLWVLNVINTTKYCTMLNLFKEVIFVF